MTRRLRPIRLHSDRRRLKLGGWYQGRQTYLWIGDTEGKPLDTISRGKLYRFAKAVVRQWKRG